MRKRNDILKVIGITTMLIDHIAYFFLPHSLLYWIMRGIGRLAFPIFAYQIAVGYRQTSNLKKYMFRLSLLALITQPIYALGFDGINIVFTPILGLLLILAYDKNYFLLTIPIILIPFIVNIEYNLFGVFLPLIFYFWQEKELYIAFSLDLVIYYFLGSFQIQFLSILSLLLIKKDWNFKLQINKYLFYFFYPYHLLILIVIKFNL